LVRLRVSITTSVAAEAPDAAVAVEAVAVAEGAEELMRGLQAWHSMNDVYTQPSPGRFAAGRESGFAGRESAGIPENGNGHYKMRLAHLQET
jgi:hypothetical protein